MLVTGDREASDGTVSVRSRSAGDLGPSSVEAFIGAGERRNYPAGQRRVVDTKQD